MVLLSLGISDLHLLMDLDIRLSVRDLRASIAPAYVKKIVRYIVHTVKGAMPVSRVRKVGV